MHSLLRGLLTVTVSAVPQPGDELPTPGGRKANGERRRDVHLNIVTAIASVQIVGGMSLTALRNAVVRIWAEFAQEIKGSAVEGL